MSGSKLGVGIVGLGLIAKSHSDGYQRIKEKVDLVGFCDLDINRAKKFAGDYQGTAYDNLHDLLKNPNIDIVDVILPHHLHYEAAMDVLNAGKHLIIEKPLAKTYQKSKDICDKADEMGKHFMVAENTRFVKGYIAAEKILREGVIGEVNHVRTFLSSNEKKRLTRPDYWGRNFNEGGGLINDCGPHSFYLLKWLVGEFREVRAFTTQVFPLGVEVEDTAEVIGKLSNGAHFICGFTSTSEIPHSERLEIYGTKGGIIVDQMASPVVKMFTGHYDFYGKESEGVPFGPDGWNPGGWHYESVVDEVVDFIDSILENRPPTINPRDCAYAIKVIEKAYESINTDDFVKVN
jgi:predicted dehydrogenase